MKVIKVLAGVAMALCSGIMIHFIAHFLFYTPSREVPTTPGIASLLPFLVGWIGSAVILLRGTKTVSKVFTRGFLLGAAEWLAMVPAAMVLSGRLLAESARRNQSDAAMAGGTIGAGVAGLMTGGVAIAMAIACLVGFAVAFLIGREMKPEEARRTKRCPECAESIQESARKCKHCGTVLVALSGANRPSSA